MVPCLTNQASHKSQRLVDMHSIASCDPYRRHGKTRRSRLIRSSHSVYSSLGPDEIISSEKRRMRYQLTQQHELCPFPTLLGHGQNSP